MNSTKRYLPLSLVLVLVCSVGDAQANSVLDPYAHVKAPVAKKKAPSAIPSVDSITTPSTYVTMPMGNLDEEKKGIVGSMLDTMTAPGKAIKNASSGMVSSTKAAGKMIGDGMAKSASVIGAGIKNSSGAIVDSTQAMGSKIANVVPNRDAGPQTKSRDVNDLYIDRVKNELASVDKAKVNSNLAASQKDIKDKKSSTRSTYLSLSKDTKKKAAPNTYPSSGFVDGAVASKAKDDAAKAQAKFNKGPAANQQPVKELASKPLGQSEKKKKWTIGFGKLKETSSKAGSGMKKLSFGVFKKKDAPAAAPKSQPIQTASAPAAKPKAQTDLMPAAAPQKQVAKTAPAPAAAPTTQVANMNKPVAKEGKFKRIPLIGKGMPSMPKLKLNPFARKKAPLAAPAQTAASPQSNLQL